MVYLFQRIESFALAVAAIVGFSQTSGSWLFFGLGLLLPDAFMFGYAFNKRFGAAAYNIGHSLFMPALFFTLGVLREHDLCLQIAAIWTAHIGIDRMFGFGLKTTKSFKHTHLGIIGK